MYQPTLKLKNKQANYGSEAYRKFNIWSARRCVLVAILPIATQNFATYLPIIWNTPFRDDEYDNEDYNGSVLKFLLPF